MKSFNHLIIFALLFNTFHISAQTHVWTGNGGDEVFSNPNNWDVLSVPDANSNVLISGSVEVFVSGTELIGDLELNNEARLVVEGTFEVSEVVIINSNFEVDGEFTGNGIFTIDVDSRLDFVGGTIHNAIIMNRGIIEITEPSVQTFNGVTIENDNMFRIFDANQVAFLNANFMNGPTGIFEAESNGGFTQQSTVSIFDNIGIVRKVPLAGTPLGTFYMIMDMNNNGIIEIPENETFLFLVASINFMNEPAARIIGDGTLDITANFVNEGIVSPGDFGTIGTLDITNNFQVQGTGVVEVDLMSTTPGEFDVIEILGAPDMNGNIEVNVVQALNVGDSFPVITWSQSGANCSFPQFVTANYDGQTYTFETFCNSNEVTLELTEIVLSNDTILAKERTFLVSPNPIEGTSIFYFSSEISTAANSALRIYNALGQLVYEKHDLKETFVFDRENLRSGLYFAQLSMDDQPVSTMKIVLK